MLAFKTLVVLAMSLAALAAPAPAEETVPADRKNEYNLIFHYRSDVLKLPALHYDAKLADNALRTVKESNGQMVHKLFPGSFGQVLAPADKDAFESAFVGGWLCEKPDLPGLNGICKKYPGWTHVSTGHVDILTSKSYSKIGCGWNAGIWGCDLA